jgi:hypothetical protein
MTRPLSTDHMTYRALLARYNELRNEMNYPSHPRALTPREQAMDDELQVLSAALRAHRQEDRR